MGVLRHELPDQRVLDHRIIASNWLIAPRVPMSCRLLLRRAVSRGALPRERFSPLTHSGHLPAYGVRAQVRGRRQAPLLTDPVGLWLSDVART